MDPSTLEAVTAELVQYLSGMFIWGHPRAQINVVPSPTIPSIIGGLLPSIYNPNLVSEESSRQVAAGRSRSRRDDGRAPRLRSGDGRRRVHVRRHGHAALRREDRAGKGRARRAPQRAARRRRSSSVRTARITPASPSRTGSASAKTTSCRFRRRTKRNPPRTLLERELTALARRRPAHRRIVATMGTTDAFGLDDLAGIVHGARRRWSGRHSLDYMPHVHADAVIGWAWSVFNDYDFDANPLGFRHRTVRALAGRRAAHPAPGAGRLDRHRLPQDRLRALRVEPVPRCETAAICERLARRDEDTPYLFQSGAHHPGRYTLETTRAGNGPMAALANLRLFGKHGLQALLGHRGDDGRSAARTSRRPCGDDRPQQRELRAGHAVPRLSRRRRHVQPAGTGAHGSALSRHSCSAHNDYNRRIFELVQADALQGRRSRDLADRLLPQDRLRRADRRAQVVHPQPVLGRGARRAVLESLWKARRALGN